PLHSPPFPYTTLFRSGAVDDVADSSRAKEVGQVAGPAAGADRPSLDLRIERLGGIPERTDRAAVGEVPHACGDDAAVPRHSRHRSEEHTSELQSQSNL